MKLFLRYVESRERQDNYDRLYHTYLTDALQIIGKNTANMFGGSILNNRFYDIINDKVVIETRTAGEIKRSIFARLDSIGELA